jgi:hypothetical protein
MAESTAVLDRVAGVLTSGGPSACTWEAVVAPLAALDRDVEARTSAATFLKDVSTDKAVREASAAAQAALSAFEVKAGMRLDVYEAVKAYRETHFPGEKGAMDAEARRFVERTMRDYRRRGLSLPPETRAELEAIRTRMSAACVAFQQTLAEDATKLAFTAAQLAGLPPDFIASLAPAPADGDGSGNADGAAAEKRFAVTLAYPREYWTMCGRRAGIKYRVCSSRTAVPAKQWCALLMTLWRHGGLRVAFALPVNDCAPVRAPRDPWRGADVVPILKQCSVPATRAAVERAFASRGHPSNTVSRRL